MLGIRTIAAKALASYLVVSPTPPSPPSPPAGGVFAGGGFDAGPLQTPFGSWFNLGKNTSNRDAKRRKRHGLGEEIAELAYAHEDLPPAAARAVEAAAAKLEGGEVPETKAAVLKVLRPEVTQFAVAMRDLDGWMSVAQRQRQFLEQVMAVAAPYMAEPDDEEAALALLTS